MNKKYIIPSIVCIGLLSLYLIIINTLGLRHPSPLEHVIVLLLISWIWKNISNKINIPEELSKEQLDSFNKYKKDRINDEPSFKYLTKDQQIKEFLKEGTSKPQSIIQNSETKMEDAWRFQILNYLAGQNITDENYKDIAEQIRQVSGVSLERIELEGFLSGLSLKEIELKRVQANTEPLLKLRKRTDKLEVKKGYGHLKPIIVILALLLIAVSLWSRKIAHDESKMKAVQVQQEAIRNFERSQNEARQQAELDKIAPLRHLATVPYIPLAQVPINYNPPQQPIPIVNRQSPITSNSSPKKGKYSSANNPKAKGIEFSIEYPDSWLAQEAERPNVVQKFFSEGGKGFDGATVTIIKLPDDMNPSESEVADLLSESNTNIMVPEESRILQTNLTKIDGQRARFVEFFSKIERANVKWVSYNHTYFIYYDKRLIYLNLQSGTVDSDSAISELNARKSRLIPIFSMMSNSFIIHNQYTK